MRRAIGGALLFALLTGCGDDGSSSIGDGGEVSDAEATVTRAQIGEAAELTDGVFVTVDGFSVELLTHEHEQLSSFVDVGVPAIMADIRAENQGPEESSHASTILMTYCADRVEDATDLSVTDPNAGVIPGNPEWPGSSPLPAGSTEQEGIALLLPGQPHMGEPLPAAICDDPVLRFTAWGIDGQRVVEVGIPTQVILEYGSAHDEYLASFEPPSGPADITVRIVNASGDPALGREITDQVASLGYQTVDPIEGQETPLNILYRRRGDWADAAFALWEEISGGDRSHIVEHAIIDDEDAVADGTLPTDGADLVVVLGTRFVEE